MARAASVTISVITRTIWVARGSREGGGGRRLVSWRLPGAPADVDLCRQLGAVADDFQRGNLARREGGDLVEHGSRIADRFAVDALQDVTCPDAGPVRWPAAQHPGDQCAAGSGQLEGVRQLRRDILGFHADPAAYHGPGADDLFHHLLGQAGGDGAATAEIYTFSPHLIM